jgi:hypothetical protein
MPRHKLSGKFFDRAKQNSFIAAIRNGNVENIELLSLEMCVSTKCADYLSMAVECGHLGVLKRLYEFGFRLDAQDATIKAIKNGHLDILLWLREIGYLRESVMCTEATIGAHPKIWTWIHENNFHCTAQHAALYGDCSLLKYLHHQGHQLTVTIFTAAASGGNLEVSRWLHQNGCPWDEGVIVTAIYNRNYTLAYWLIQYGCPLNEDAIRVAISNLNYILARWLIQNECPCSEVTRNIVLEYWNEFQKISQVIQILEGFNWDEGLIRDAITNRNYTFAYWLIQNGCPCCEVTRNFVMGCWNAHKK